MNGQRYKEFVKTPQKENSPDDLSRVLQEWRSEAALPPGFQASVWRRIDLRTAQAERGSFLEAMTGWLSQLVARPQMAAAYVAALVLVGVTVGWTQGQHENARIHGQLAERYLATLDPSQPSRQIP